MTDFDTMALEDVPHKVTVRHRSTDGTQDDYGQYVYTEVDTEYPCRFEFQDVSKVSHRTSDQEYVPQHFLQLYMMPTAPVLKADSIVQVKAANNEVVYTEDENNPLMVEEIWKIPADAGIHHLEVYCDFRNPKT